MLIQQGMVFTKRFVFEPLSLRLEDGVIRGMGPELSARPGEEVVDAAGLRVIPGLVDVHFHGCAGADFSDGTEEALHTIAVCEKKAGVTTICPASMTLPEERLLSVCRTAAAHVRRPGEAALAGIHLEGPMISPERVGAQNPAFVRCPDAALLRRLQEAAGGLIRLVTLAPELPGAAEVIRELGGQMHFSVGHTCADYAAAAAAFEAGADHLTHLFNAMPGLHHRRPGPAAAGAERGTVFAELIGDGIHVHPAMVQAAFRLFGAERIVLISDSTRAAGCPDGTYELGGQLVEKRDGAAWLTEDTLAGSAVSLFDCLRTVAGMGIPLADAVRAAAWNPAVSIGAEKECGAIAPGMPARILLVAESLDLVRVITEEDC